MSRGNLFIISGPSGTGKGTICKELLTKHDDIYLSVSVTTRNRRNEEVDGVTYIFDTVEGFKKRIDNNMMLEWAQYGDNYYGTPKDIVEENLKKGINVILEIEVQGALKVKEKMPDAVMIFVLPPSMKELESRLVNRGREDRAEIEKRIEIAMGEISKASLYNYIVVNEDLELCVNEVRQIIDKRREQMEFVNCLIEDSKKL